MKKPPEEWTDEEAEQVLKSILSVVYSDIRDAAEKDIRALIQRAKHLASPLPQRGNT